MGKDAIGRETKENEYHVTSMLSECKFVKCLDRLRTQIDLAQIYKWASAMLNTFIFGTSWNNDIGVFLGLGEREIVS